MSWFVSQVKDNHVCLEWHNESEIMRMSFIGQVYLRGIYYSDRSSKVQQNDSNRTRRR